MLIVIVLDIKYEEIYEIFYQDTIMIIEEFWLMVVCIRVNGCNMNIQSYVCGKKKKLEIYVE